MGLGPKICRAPGLQDRNIGTPLHHLRVPFSKKQHFGAGSKQTE